MIFPPSPLPNEARERERERERERTKDVECLFFARRNFVLLLLNGEEAMFTHENLRTLNVFAV